MLRSVLNGMRTPLSDDYVLYVLDIPALVYPVLMHRLSVNSDKKAILFVDKNQFVRRYDINSIHNFKKNGLFEDVVDCRLFVDKAKARANATPEDEYIVHFDSELARIPYRLSDFSEIVVCNDVWDGDINLYLNLKEIQYSWIQVAKNHVFTYVTQPKLQIELQNKYKFLTYDAPYALPYVLEQSDKTIEYLNQSSKEYKIWNLEKAYNNLGIDDVLKIARSYNIQDIGDVSSATLLIKNSGGAIEDGITYRDWGKEEPIIRLLSGSRQFSMDDFTPVIDKIALDFYAMDEEKLYIKEHPNCPINDVQREIYNEDICILPKIPFEFLAKYLTNTNTRFKTVIGYISSSLVAIDASFGSQIYILGNKFWRTCFFYSSLYAALSYAHHCGFDAIYCSDLIKCQLEFLRTTVDYEIQIHSIAKQKLGELKNSLIISDYVVERNNLRNQMLQRVHNTSAVCFLNVELTNEFFEDALMPYMAAVDIKKEKLSEGFLNLHRDERLWIYTKSNPVLKATRYFTMEKILPRCGLRVYVEESTLADSVELFQTCTQRNKVMQLSKQVELLTRALARSTKTDLAPCLLCETTDLQDYVQMLSTMKDRYLMILSVRDTPGNCIPDAVVKQLRELGFTKFTKELWRMYVGVLSCGAVVCDQVGSEREAPVNFAVSDVLNQLSLEVSSMAWRQGNKSEIKINGVDYSTNIRGLNFVVYDLQERQVVDAVGFDCHTVEWKTVRK